METPTIFQTDDYRGYMAHLIQASGRGTQKQLAQHIGCQASYLTRILQSKAELSLEQAERVCRFFSFSQDQQRYFLTLVEQARAGSTALRQHFATELRAMREQQANLKRRYQKETKLSEGDIEVYYSDWQKMAVHAAATLPTATDPEQIARRLEIPLNRVHECLKFLLDRGFLTLKDGRYVDNVRQLHLGHDSAVIMRHHINWRLQAIEAFNQGGGDNLHYSSLITLSEKDLEQAKHLLRQAIDQIKALVRDSKDETMAVFNLDFFEF